MLHNHTTIGELTLAAKSSCFILSVKSLCERLSWCSLLQSFAAEAPLCIHAIQDDRPNPWGKGDPCMVRFLRAVSTLCILRRSRSGILGPGTNHACNAKIDSHKGKTQLCHLSLDSHLMCMGVSLSLSLFLSLLALTTHLPLKQGKKLKTHSATLVVGRPAEANFAPREVWISILSYWHCNKVKCIEMISSHTHTHTGHCLLNFLQAKLHWRSWQWQGCRIVPQSMVDLRKLVQFHRWLVT